MPFLGSNFELVDSSTQPQPWLEYTRERLPESPLWNPYVGGGRPHFANTQSAVLSPFSLPAYLLPFWWSLGLIGRAEGLRGRVRAPTCSVARSA